MNQTKVGNNPVQTKAIEQKRATYNAYGNAMLKHKHQAQTEGTDAVSKSIKHLQINMKGFVSK